MATIIAPPPDRTAVASPLPARRPAPDVNPVHRLALLAALALAIVLGLSPLLVVPAVVPADAPSTALSAERAMQQLRVLAADSRGIGLPGHDAAIAYLMAELRALGLEPEVQTATAVQRFPGNPTFASGRVTNVVARLPGTASTGAIALNAHYDSGPTGPGASDCGSCVVTTLETLRAVQAGPPLRNDLIVVFTDAEEKQDLGAGAFTDQHPWAGDVRLALNFEALGSGGPALLYATSRDNGWLTGEFFRVAPHVAAYSLWPEIVRLLPMLRGACDLEDYLEQGSAGLGFIYQGDTPAYHTLRDSVDEIDPRSLQQEGGYTLAAVRHFGNLDLTAPPRAADRVFFTLLPGVVVHYPGAWVTPLATVVSLLVVAVVVAGLRRRRLTPGGLAAATLAIAIGTLGSVILTALLWAGIRSAVPAYQAFMVGVYASLPLVVGLTLAALAPTVALVALLGRRVRSQDLQAGAVVGGTLLLWPVSLAAPGASYLVVWPLLGGLALLAWMVSGGRRAEQPWWRLAVLAVAALPALALLPGTLYQLVPILSYIEAGAGIPLLGLIALVVAPLAGLLVPHLDLLAGRRRWHAPGALALGAVALLALAGASAGFDADHPRPDRIAYELDADTGTARWVSPDAHLDLWTAQFFPAGAVRGADGFVAPAPSVSLPAPAVAVLADTTAGDTRTLRLRLSSPRGAYKIQVMVDAPGEIVAAAVDDRPLDLREYDLAPAGRLSLTYNAVPASGLELALTVRSAAPLGLALRDTSHGLPTLPGVTIQPRPPETMPALGMDLDPTIVVSTWSLAR
jgi:hypothetical protein